MKNTPVPLIDDADVKEGQQSAWTKPTLLIGTPLVVLIAIGVFFAIQPDSEPESNSGFVPPAHCLDVKPDEIQPGTDFCSPDAFLN